ncbi:MAG: cell division protein ZapA [Clostridia bacterium]|nr:cell division protein ZapA [Clostridia bacterium]
MEKERIRLNIAGNDYFITTDEDAEYVQRIGEDLDETLSKILHDNSRLSVTQAAILAALDYADKAIKATDSAENLRGQIKEYLEDSARYKMEAEVSRREIERLNRELMNASSSRKKPF